MNNYEETSAACPDQDITELEIPESNPGHLELEFDDGAFFETKKIDLEHLVPVMSFHSAIQNPDLTDKYVNDLLRLHYGSSPDSSHNSPVMQSMCHENIGRTIFSIFRSESRISIQDLRSEMLSKKRQSVIVPLQSGNDEFDREHQKEQELASKRF